MSVVPYGLRAALCTFGEVQRDGPFTEFSFESGVTSEPCTWPDVVCGCMEQLGHYAARCSPRSVVVVQRLVVFAGLTEMVPPNDLPFYA